MIASDSVFEKRLREALFVARGGQTAIVVVPAGYPKLRALGIIAKMLVPEKDWNARVDLQQLYFEGTRGSVRVYNADHVTYNAAQKRMLNYPTGIPTFLHPEMESA